ncbi:MAG: cytochrome c peroxidase [Pseudohongiella sp.]|nr:cytochrome c peroxidase [Pseudohongiella sp.]
MSALNALLKHRQPLVLMAVFFSYANAQSTEIPQTSVQLEALGQQLFFDTDLSFNRSQSCATCHDPARAFTDTRLNHVNSAASIGADGRSLGDRQAPSLSYAAQTPAMHEIEDGKFAGGYFWDGRAVSLEQQAVSPLYSPIEMALPDVSVLKQRLLEKEFYQQAFSTLFSDDIWNKPDALNDAFASAVAAYQRTEIFSPFDSRYDRYLRGEYKPTLPETIGMGLFFSQGFANCSHCHQLNTLPNSVGETFSNYQYENIGLAANTALRDANGKGADFVDSGFMEQGRFKVPSLRNVAVTAPYMHNGIFNELRTVLLFYNKFNTTGGTSQINPETQQPWGEPEIDGHRDMEKLNGGIPLSRLHMDALEAFMRMLTDQQYEHLLP